MNAIIRNQQTVKNGIKNTLWTGAEITRTIENNVEKIEVKLDDFDERVVNQPLSYSSEILKEMFKKMYD